VIHRIVKKPVMRNYKCFILFFILCTGNNNVFSQSWNSLRGVFGNEGPRVMYADTAYLYVAGAFNTVNSMHIQGIARWNGLQWDSMGAGINGLNYLIGSSYPPNTLAITNYYNKLYVGGVFTSLGNVSANSIGAWNGSVWDSLPVQPFKNTYNLYGINAMSVIQGKLYVGGWFDTIAEFPCIGISQWNDTNWSSLNFPNLENFFTVDVICEYRGSIFVGGNFYDSIPNDSISNILKWDGANWLSVGGGIKGLAVGVQCMVIYNGDLYVAGYFFKSDGNAGNNIQKWNGTSWSDVGGGTNDQIDNLLVFDGKLYAMGVFTTAGGVPASKIGEWNGTQWCSLGSTFNNTILTGSFYQDTLYVGGAFNTIDADSINFIAKWLGGNYVDTCGNDATGENTLIIKSEEIMVFPNPNDGQFTLSISNVNEKCSIEIYNVLGETTYGAKVSSGNTEINLSGQPNGVYLYRVLNEDGGLVGEGKLVIEK
jgi:trimeric autotransporter adhesin